MIPTIVSARYVPKAVEAEPDQVFVTYDNGAVWLIYADSDHPDWVAYLAEDGTIEATP